MVKKSAQCKCTDGWRSERCWRPVLRDGYCDYCVRMYPCDHSTTVFPKPEDDG